MRKLSAALLLVLMAAVLVIPSGISAQATTATRFKGKAVVKTDNTAPYVVVNFTCDGTQSGNWTYEVSSTVSFSGNLPDKACELTATSGSTWSTAVPIGGDITINTTPTPTSATLALNLTNVGTGKTFIPVTYPNCPKSSACVEASIVSSNTNLVPSFDSNTAQNSGIATLTLSVPWGYLKHGDNRKN